MLSRLRSNAEGVTSYVKATMNPEPKEAEGGWLHEFLDDYYLDDYGYPIPERSGDIRWFISDENGQLAWGNSKEELQAQYGLDCAPMSFTFVSAQLYDNLCLCQRQPQYVTALKNLGRVERERLLYGGWNVSPKGTGYFRREWVEFVEPKDVPKRLKTIRSWDLASSIESELSTDPDYSASVKISLCDDGMFYVEHANDFRARPAGVSAQIMQKAEFDGKNCPIGLPQDVGQAGVVAFQHYARPLILKGFKVKKMKTRKGKVERFSGFSNAAENGMVRIVKGDWNDRYISQLENFDPDRKRQHDDLVDATSDSYNFLVSGKTLPETLKIPKLNKPNQWTF